eukprot:6874657-Alexandrium_andersonii.AAC.1
MSTSTALCPTSRKQRRARLPASPAPKSGGGAAGGPVLAQELRSRQRAQADQGAPPFRWGRGR